jgi:hypothetical protein
VDEKLLGKMEWIILADVRDQCSAVVKAVMKHLVP